MSEPMLSITDLATYFFLANGVVKAVDGVNLTVEQEEILTIVGESGSGKSVTALSIMGLIQPPGRVVRGSVMFEGRDLLTLSQREMESVRGLGIGMIFQNPFTSLHPYFRIGHQMTEPIRLRKRTTKAAARREVADMLVRIGIEAPDTVLDSFPFEVSAGVNQRVMLAIALLGNPRLLIADEPTTNLDAMAQVQILDLIKELRDTFHMSVLLITHDFGVVSRMADRIVVMYAARQVETGSAADILSAPQHPYSIGLINSVPAPGEKRTRLQQIPGEVPDVMRLPPGCSFRPRCPHAMDLCHRDPPMTALKPAHEARCWLFSADAEGTA